MIWLQKHFCRSQSLRKKFDKRTDENSKNKISGENMNIIKDKALAKSGHDKINWVKSYMPVLNSIEAEFERIKPFAGKKIAMSIHLEAKTAVSCHV